MLNNKGPSTDPRGTSAIIFVQTPKGTVYFTALVVIWEVTSKNLNRMLV